MSLPANFKPLGDVKTMKRNGLTVTPKQLKMKASELEFECKGDENQRFEIPILNPDGTSDGWILEEPAE